MLRVHLFDVADRRLFDFLQRLLRALPAVRQWIATLHATHVRDGIPASDAGFPALAKWFPADLLERTQMVATPIMPFPPVAAYGIPEFQAMTTLPMAGITWGHMYFVDPARAAIGVHAHELAHAAQWRSLGVDDFLLTYAVALALHGYEKSPLETIAFEVQTQVESDTREAPIVERIERHAIAARNEAAAIFRVQGVRWDVEREPAEPAG
jgi:hypothetical protein